MWERIGASSGIIIGAFVLFLIFVFVLFFIEQFDEKRMAKRKKTPYLVPNENHDQHHSKVKPLRNSSAKQNQNHAKVYSDTRIRKIG